MKIELLGNISNEDRIKIIASAGKLSRFKGNVFEVIDSCNDFEKNIKLVKRIIKMGHKSIIEHDYFVFAIADVSPIVEQTVIGNRLTSFTIKSRREVDFRNVGYYMPTFKTNDNSIHPQNNELVKKYQKHMKYLFDEYAYFVDNNINVEDARFVLPYSYYSNMIMGMDARKLERLVVSLLYGKLSKIDELKELGEKLFDIVKDKITYLVDGINNYEVKNEEFFDFDKFKRDNNLNIKILSKPKVLEHTKDCDNQILLSFLMGEYQCNKEDAITILQKLSEENPEFKEKLMKHIITKEENRELEQIDFQLQIPISLAILTHLTRHRMHSLIVPDFVPIWNLENYTIPKTVKKFDLDRYKSIYKNNNEIYDYFKNKGVREEDLVYFYLSGHMCNVLTKMNGRTLEWICRMRCCNKAQWQIRDIMKEIARQVKTDTPLYGAYLGPSCETLGFCPEGEESCRAKVKMEVV